MAFPTLSSGAKWVIDGHEEGPQFDPTLTTKSSAGYGQRVVHATNIPEVSTWPLTNLTAADVVLIKAFQRSVWGAVPFDWTHPLTDATHEVVFDPSCLPIKFVPFAVDRWQTKKPLTFILPDPS